MRPQKQFDKMYEELQNKVWYGRSFVGYDKYIPAQKKQVQKLRKDYEKKYGKKTLQECFANDFTWGELIGKFEAFNWFCGEDFNAMG